MGSTLSIFGTLKLGSDIHFPFADGAIYGFKNTANAAYPADPNQFVSRRISFPEESAGHGQLHGIWTADTAVSLSDRRLKTNIMPLHRTLVARMTTLQANEPAPPPSDSTPMTSRSSRERTAAVSWVLRELRPVSFQFRKTSEAKKMDGPRYGFVAQDVERILPDLVQTVGETKHMIYQDLIAMITLVVQDLQARLEKQNQDLQQQNLEMSKLRSSGEQQDFEMSKLRGTVENLDSKFERLERLILSRSGGMV